MGYLLKDRILVAKQLDQALHRLAEGGTVVDSDLVEELMTGRPRPGRLGRLTDRELQVLRLMAEGRSDRGIATELSVSTNTVGTHVQRIFHKLDLSDSALGNRRVLAVLAFLQRG
jgi:DNA-binding NarL/FixJ family response regulator